MWAITGEPILHTHTNTCKSNMSYLRTTAERFLLPPSPEELSGYSTPACSLVPRDMTLSHLPGLTKAPSSCLSWRFLRALPRILGKDASCADLNEDTSPCCEELVPFQGTHSLMLALLCPGPHLAPANFSPWRNIIPQSAEPPVSQWSIKACYLRSPCPLPTALRWSRSLWCKRTSPAAHGHPALVPHPLGREIHWHFWPVQHLRRPVP